jgi:IS30 family transposase
MGASGPPGLPQEQLEILWSQWKSGHRMREIGRGLGIDHGCVRSILLVHGGFTPAARHRAPRVLTSAEREIISRGIAADEPTRAIARRLNRSASTISREIARHGGRGTYRATQADRRAWRRARRPKRCVLAINRRLRETVTSKLMLEWSPEQISGWLKIRYADDESMRVSHETIYRSLFIQARGVLKKQLIGHLRSGRKLRHSRKAGKNSELRGRIPDAVSIRERPAEVEDRAVPGHWEGDLISGSKNSHIVTLVERRSRFTALVKVPNRETVVVVKALARQIRRLPVSLRRSLTWDRGHELSRHQDFTVDTKVKVYFCDPHSPWQRGTNENTNRLLRQYFPRGTDLSQHTQAHLDRIALRLNQRPRETLGFMTPADKLRQRVASTH